MFSPDHRTGRGAARCPVPPPAPVTTHEAQLLLGSPGVNTSQCTSVLHSNPHRIVKNDSEIVSIGQITQGDSGIIINENRLFVSFDGTIYLFQTGLMRNIKKPISQSLRHVFGRYLHLDQFYLLMFFY